MRNCQLTDDEFDLIVSNKLEILEQLRVNYGEFQNNNTVLEVLYDLSESAQLNNDQTEQEVKEILDDTMELGDSDIVLTEK